MRKIDKRDILATQYKKWLDNLLEDADHPKYNSSKSKYYYDIIANLIWIQKGLCAYTEYFMQDYQQYRDANWTGGVFPEFAFAGELDHYYPHLKENRGWLWDNFFLIDADVNSKKVKGSKVPFGILKPDKIDFDPFYYLEYDISNHLFLPSNERGIDEQLDILHDLKVLGLNWQPTVERRANYLNPIINDVRYGVLTYDDAYGRLYQFFTAFELCKNYMI